MPYCPTDLNECTILKESAMVENDKKSARSDLSYSLDLISDPEEPG